MTDYDSVQWRLIPVRLPTEIGGGWFRRQVAIEFVDAPNLETFEPPDASSLQPTTPIVLLIQSSPNTYRLIMDSRHPDSGDDLAYLSLVVQRLRKAAGRFLIDGHEDHPLLRLVRPPEDIP